jgi:NAD(P)-dependent dehydrogenase (short-subunit alcohol dehydrogenase family)
MKGKLCLITGASAGIGYSTALRLAQMGMNIIIASNNEERGIRAKQQLITTSKNPNIEYMQVDLASFSSIHNFATKFMSAYKKLDVLINNAGVYYSKQVFTEDEVEMQFAVNHIAPFMITGLLMEPLKATEKSRIVNVSSRFHFQGKLHFENLYLDKQYTGLRAYCQSKLANVLFTYKLAEMLGNNGVTVNCLHPGTAKTRIGHTNSTGFYPIFCSIIRPVLTTTEKASRTSVLLASSGEVEGVSGKYFERRKAAKSSKASYIKEDANRLWEISEDISGIKYQ